jgi:hypothetical protein
MRGVRGIHASAAADKRRLRGEAPKPLAPVQGAFVDDRISSPLLPEQQPAGPPPTNPIEAAVNGQTYLGRVAGRSESVLERRMVRDSKERERRRNLGLEPRTNPMLLPLRDDDPNSTAALLQQLERGSKKDIMVSIPSTNEVRVYRRARTDLKAAQRSMAPVVVDNELLEEASVKARQAAHRVRVDRAMAEGSGQPPPSEVEEPTLGTLGTAEVVPINTSAPSYLPTNYVHKPCDLRRTLHLSDADRQGSLGHDQWALWITQRQELPPVDPNAGRSNRRRIRHHRRSCRYNLYSTNRDFRQLSLQTTFPTRMMRDSLAKLQHAVHGSSNGTSRLDFRLDDFFVPMTVGWWAAPEFVAGGGAADVSMSPLLQQQQQQQVSEPSGVGEQDSGGAEEEPRGGGLRRIADGHAGIRRWRRRRWIR